MPSVQEKLRQKLEEGEISQEEYEQLLQGLKKIGVLEEETIPQEEGAERVYKKIVVNGAKTIPGGVNKGGTYVNGKLRVIKHLVTVSLNVNGKAEFEEGLEIRGNTKINGKVEIKGKAVFVGPIKVSGKINSSSDVIFGSSAHISGKGVIKGELMATDLLKIVGKIESHSLSSTGKVVASGPIRVEEGIVAEEFLSKAGGGKAKFIRGKKIIIGEDYDSLPGTQHNNIKVDEISNFVDLARYLTDLITKTVSRSRTFGEPRVFEVEGNVDGEDVQLSYAHVKGDVIGTNVTIDENTKVEGVIRYRESVTLPESVDFETVQIA